MRTIALCVGLVLAAGVSAAPTTPAEVGKVMRVLGMEGLGEQGASTLVGMVPSLAALDEAGRQCATRQVGVMMDAQMQQQIAAGLGEDGAALMQEWTGFLATPAGQDMGRTFRATSPVAGAGAAGGEAPQVSDAHKTEIAAFMGTPAFQRFIGGISAEDGMPEDIGVRLATVLQRECSIAFDPNEIS